MTTVVAVHILQRMTAGDSTPVVEDALMTDEPESELLTTDDDEQLLMDE